MFRKSFFIVVSFLLFMQTNMKASSIADSALTNDLWQSTVKPYLQEPIWESTMSYNAGHFLMVPLHAAFELNNVAWQHDFAEHFARFADKGYLNMGSTHLYRIQYLYLASEFILLCKQTNNDSLIPPNLYDILFQKVNKTWNVDPVWQWKYGKVSPSTFKNMRTKVLWKLYTKDMKEVTYFRAIIDEELFTMAVAANLKHYLFLKSLAPNNVLDDITQIATEVFHKRVQWTADSGWLFQPGYWHNHEDFVYAGNDSIGENLAKKEVADVAEDVSHSLRMPLWLRSFHNAYPAEDKNSIYFASLIKGLEIQFFEKIAIAPDSTRPYYLVNNFMDGKNGVYRYHYSNRAGGMGPYELTYHLPLGWWCFLGTERTRLMYQTISDNFPLEPGKIVYYYQRELDAKPAILKEIDANQLKKLICMLATALPIQQ